MGSCCLLLSVQTASRLSTETVELTVWAALRAGPQGELGIAWAWQQPRSLGADSVHVSSQDIEDQEEENGRLSCWRCQSSEHGVAETVQAWVPAAFLVHLEHLQIERAGAWAPLSSVSLALLLTPNMSPSALLDKGLL